MGKPVSRRQRIWRSASQRDPTDTRWRVSPHDAAGLGIESGDEVRVTSTRGSQVLPVTIDPGVPAGIAQLDFSADGAGAAALIDARAVVTDLRLETLSPSGREAGH